MRFTWFVAQRFACSLVTLDREQHDRAIAVLHAYTPDELLQVMGEEF